MTQEQIKKKIEELEKARQAAINDFEVAKGNIRYYDGTIDALRLSLMEVPEGDVVDVEASETDANEAQAEAVP